MHKVTIMSKPGCHRCEQITEAIRKLIRFPVMIEVVDVVRDQELLEQYGKDVPVVLIDGIERFRQTVDPQKFLKFFADEPGAQIVGYTSS